MSNELNPCGCGGEAYIFRGNGYYIECEICGNQTKHYLTANADKAKIDWNRAHPLAIRLDDIREMVEYCKTEDSIDACIAGTCRLSQMCRAVCFGFNASGIMNIDVDTIAKYCRERGEG